jgi:hypothetical protein
VTTLLPDWTNQLYYGDNLEIMRQHIADKSARTGMRGVGVRGG